MNILRRNIFNRLKTKYFFYTRLAQAIPFEKRISIVESPSIYSISQKNRINKLIEQLLNERSIFETDKLCTILLSKLNSVITKTKLTIITEVGTQRF